METFWQDLRYALRILRKNPGFTGVAVITLALGIGANTAIFSVVNATLLRRLPFKDPDRLAILWGTAPQMDRTSISEPNFLDYKEQNHVFEHMASFYGAGLTLTGGPNPERIRGGRVTADFFKVVGVQPLLGQTFLPDQDQPGHNSVVVLAHSLWQQRFGSDPNIVGQTMLIEAKPYTILGVLPAGFEFLVPGYFSNPQVWIPAVLKRDNAQRGNNYLRVIAKLKPGVSLPQAQADLDAIAHRIAQENPQLNSGGTRLVPLKEQIVKDSRTILFLLLGAVGFVLLIACANVTNLQLARAAGRQKEFAIRAALRGSRGRVVRQLLTESLLLALGGGALGVILAAWGIRLLTLPAVGGVGSATASSIDGRVLVFSLLLSLGTGILFGLAPALRSADSVLVPSLKEGGKNSSAGVRGRRLRNALTISEVALSVVLLIGAGLLLRSFVRLLEVKPGFDSQNLLTLSLVLPRYSYSDATSRAAFWAEATKQVAALPGVKAVGAIDDLPLTPDHDADNFTIEGRGPVAVGELPVAQTRSITPNYFRAMNIPLIEGRDFAETDSSKATPVLIINQTVARRVFSSEDPVGRRVTFGVIRADSQWMTIVGVAGDVRDLALDTPTQPEVYQPYQQSTLSYMNLAIRSNGDPRSLAASVRNAVQSLDKNLPVSPAIPMENVVADSIATRRFNMILLGVFAGLALFLAAVGIYGVMAYVVTQRTLELGIRIALGAQGRDVLQLVVGQGIMLAVFGVGIGLAAALALTRLMTSLLYEVKATDPAIFIGVALLLVFVALLACLVPARRATKVDPLVSLRYE